MITKNINKKSEIKTDIAIHISNIISPYSTYNSNNYIDLDTPLLFLLDNTSEDGIKKTENYTLTSDKSMFSEDNYKLKLMTMNEYKEFYIQSMIDNKNNRILLTNLFKNNLSTILPEKKSYSFIKSANFLGISNKTCNSVFNKIIYTSLDLFNVKSVVFSLLGKENNILEIYNNFNEKENELKEILIDCFINFKLIINTLIKIFFETNQEDIINIGNIPFYIKKQLKLITYDDDVSKKLNEIMENPESIDPFYDKSIKKVIEDKAISNKEDNILIDTRVNNSGLNITNKTNIEILLFLDMHTLYETIIKFNYPVHYKKIDDSNHILNNLIMSYENSIKQLEDENSGLNKFLNFVNQRKRPCIIKAEVLGTIKNKESNLSFHDSSFKFINEDNDKKFITFFDIEAISLLMNGYILKIVEIYDGDVYKSNSDYCPFVSLLEKFKNISLIFEKDILQNSYIYENILLIIKNSITQKMRFVKYKKEGIYKKVKPDDLKLAYGEDKEDISFLEVYVNSLEKDYTIRNVLNLSRLSENFKKGKYSISSIDKGIVYVSLIFDNIHYLVSDVINYLNSGLLLSPKTTKQIEEQMIINDKKKLIDIIFTMYGSTKEPVKNLKLFNQDAMWNLNNILNNQ